MCLILFFFNDTATTVIYTYGHTLSLHDALPISGEGNDEANARRYGNRTGPDGGGARRRAARRIDGDRSNDPGSDIELQRQRGSALAPRPADRRRRRHDDRAAIGRAHV